MMVWHPISARFGVMAEFGAEAPIAANFREGLNVLQFFISDARRA
jgi:hypothetical protein